MLKCMASDINFASNVNSVTLIHGTVPIFTISFSIIQFNIILSLSLSLTHIHTQVASCDCHAWHFPTKILYGVFVLQSGFPVLYILIYSFNIKNSKWRSQIVQFLLSVTPTPRVNMFSSNTPLFLNSFSLLFKRSCFRFITFPKLISILSNAMVYNKTLSQAKIQS